MVSGMDKQDLMNIALRQEQERTDQPLTQQEQKDPILSATWALVRARRRYIRVARQFGCSFAWISAAISMSENHVRASHEVDEQREVLFPMVTSPTIGEMAFRAMSIALRWRPCLWEQLSDEKRDNMEKAAVAMRERGIRGEEAFRVMTLALCWRPCSWEDLSVERRDDMEKIRL